MTMPRALPIRQHGEPIGVRHPTPRQMQVARVMEKDLQSALSAMLAGLGRYPAPRMEYSNALRRDGSSSLRPVCERLARLMVPLAEAGVPRGALRHAVAGVIEDAIAGLYPETAMLSLPAVLDVECHEQGEADDALRAAERHPDDPTALERAAREARDHRDALDAVIPVIAARRFQLLNARSR